MNHTLPALIAFTAVGALPAAAEVTASADNGFNVAHEIVLDAAPVEVWAALIEPSRWWNGEHSWSGDAANFSLEPVAGGCFCETWTGENGQQHSVEHLTVASALPGEKLILRGALGPLQDQGVDGALAFTLAAEDAGTRLTATYRVGGYIDGMEEWPAAVDFVIGEQVTRLAALIATGSPETK